jgi:hypothetical protein
MWQAISVANVALCRINDLEVFTDFCYLLPGDYEALACFISDR